MSDQKLVGGPTKRRGPHFGSDSASPPRRGPHLGSDNASLPKSAEDLSQDKKVLPPQALTPSLALDSIEFVELLGRSNFSFLQGASDPEEMIQQAMTLGYKGLALCDLNGLYGVVRAYQKVAFPSHFLTPQTDQVDFKFHTGAEMQIREGGSVALLPMNKEGYGRLCHLITLAKRNAQKNFSGLTLNDVCIYNEDLIALALPPWSQDHLKTLKDTFTDRLYLPVWKDLTWASLELYNHALELERLGFSLVATNRPFMHIPERKPLHDVLTCIFHGCTLVAARTRRLANHERHLQTLSELKTRWQDRPDLLAQSVAIAHRLQFDLSELKYQYPQASRPSELNATEYLALLTEKGLNWRYPQGVPTEVQKITQKELGLIHELAYEDYFLTLYDICEFARAQKILFQGRGSAANSVVCFALGLTAVDPTQVRLSFERFISKERGEPPDIDIDFDSERREEVIQYIYQKYGSEHAAMVCTVICYRSRLALREAAKVFGVSLQTVDTMVKFMGREGLERLHENPKQAKNWGITDKLFQLLIRAALDLVGFPRHLGIHSGGFLIAQRPITECVPVERASMDKRYVIQWNKDDLTVLKMMKIDVLGLGMLGALHRSFAMLQTHKQISLDLASFPADDVPTYAMIQKADTIGVFQIESRAQMSLLPRLRPKNFYDLVVEVAIVRPGPIQGGMVHPYIRRRHGLEKVEYAHPDLVPILEKTFGVPIFQEQIMQIASTVAGFTPGEADELRRIMSSSWKKSDLMAGLRQRLLNGMINHGIELPYAERIYQTIIGFASYGFPESHAASFALLTYASCYLKQHHPDVFACALLNSQPMGFYSPRVLIGDAQRHGVRFLPVDIQRSDFDYDLECTHRSAEGGPSRWAVRTGLRAVYGLQKKHVEHLLLERQQGLFQDFTDLVQRTQLPKNVLLRLGAAGALVPLGLNARQSLWRIQAMELKPESLFFASARETLHTDPERDLVPEENSWQKLKREFGTLGFSLTHHPIGLLRPELEKAREQNRRSSLAWTKSVQLTEIPTRAPVRMAGLLSLVQRPPTAKGFAFLSLEDESGLFNVVLVPAMYEKFRLVIAFHQLLEIHGHLEKAEGVINVRATTLEPLIPEPTPDF